MHTYLEWEINHKKWQIFKSWSLPRNMKYIIFFINQVRDTPLK